MQTNTQQHVWIATQAASPTRTAAPRAQSVGQAGMRTPMPPKHATLVHADGSRKTRVRLAALHLLWAPLLWADLPLSTYLEVGRLWIATNMTCASALDPVLLVRTTTGSDLASRVRQAGQVSKDKRRAIRATRGSTRKSREVCAWTVLRDGSRINPPKQA